MLGGPRPRSCRTRRSPACPRSISSVAAKGGRHWGHRRGDRARATGRTVPGATWRSPAGESLTGPPREPAGISMSTLALAHRGPRSRRYDESIMLTSRGCPHGCTFCYTPAAFDRTIRYHPSTGCSRRSPTWPSAEPGASGLRTPTFLQREAGRRHPGGHPEQDLDVRCGSRPGPTC